MRVVVTGGAGFIGANLCRSLVNSDWVRDIVVVDDLSTGFRSNLDGTDVRLIEGSVLDRDLLASAMEGADAVVHLAARPSVPRSLADPVASHEANATGSLFVLEAARAVGAYVIVASSSSVYGDTDVLPKHENLPARPMSPYAASKLVTEAYAAAYRASFSLPTLAFRFFNVYGPLQAAGHAYAAVVPAFVDAALRAQPVHVHGDGLQTRDFTYVGTVVEVLKRALFDRSVASGPLNLAFGTRSSLQDLLDLLEKHVGHPIERSHGEPRRGDVRDSQASSVALQAMFPDVEPVPLTVGLAETVEWFRRSKP